MRVQELAKLYFELSNQKKLDEISSLIDGQATYSSDNTGLHFGRTAIMQMMTKFFDAFSELAWQIDSIRELDVNIVEIQFSFQGKKKSGEELAKQGIERIVVVDGFLRHIEVRNP